MRGVVRLSFFFCFILTTPPIKAKIGLDCVYPWDSCALFGAFMIERSTYHVQQSCNGFEFRTA